eukprot:CAMPEP_0184498456 /NCGR_PEP_ID=MMETSP0113_2-20130426/39038_1 /TAXON_ID=91329 /ORGANISM="Norrisiella sphaerica, Strain BC52" /LENGTH=418 /DNA_ID=CAMNT_0026885969 /DNA_START=320 /DNA_END=1576 /DNA_ORIENTATION=+
MYKITSEESSRSLEKWFITWEALLRYRELHGNLLVPHRYIVPESGIWPSHLHGFKLGQKVRNIRAVGLHVKNHPDRIEMLNEIGFIWDDNDFRFKQTLKSLRTYKKLHGTLAIPVDYVVPSEDPWDPVCWGIPLGDRVHNIRAHDLHIKNNPKRRRMLEDLGFIWDDEAYRWRQLIDALSLYRTIYGNVDIRQDYVVGSDDDRWPQHLHGYKLGDKSRALRTSQIWIKDNPFRRRELERLGFNLKPRQSEKERTLEYFKHFQRQHGHCNVPRKYIAKFNDSSWTRILESTGVFKDVALGSRAQRLRTNRNKLSPEYEEALDSIGFVWNYRDGLFDRIVEALKIYKELEGSFIVPRSFAVPESDAWPRNLHNFPLGEKVHKMKYFGSYIKNRPDRQEKLRHLGYTVPRKYDEALSTHQD